MTALIVGGPCAARSLELCAEALSRIDASHQIPDISLLIEGREGSAVRLSGLQQLAGAGEDARFVHVASDDGSFTANLPIDQAAAHGIVIYALGGEPLPQSLGGPFRLLLIEGYDCSVNVKFLARVEFVEDPGTHTARCSD